MIHCRLICYDTIENAGNDMLNIISENMEKSCHCSRFTVSRSFWIWDEYGGGRKVCQTVKNCY